ncbi:MAG: reprolysin-like metallopeptidase, partial [Flavobacteriales bacterium]
MIKKRTYYFLILVFSPLLAEAQGIKSIPLLWQEVPFESTLLMGNPRIQVDHGKVFKLQLSTIIEELKTVTYREGNMKGSVAEVSFPYQDGSFHAFTAKRNQTMHPLLNEKFPEIVTLDAYATDGSGAYGKWDITPAGLHAMIFIPGESTLFIDPLFEGNNEYYVVYRKKDFKTTKTIDCGVVNADESKPGNPVKTMFGTCELRTYRLALSATAEYTTFHGGTVNQAAAAQVVTMNRVNGVYEKDIAITMVIIPNNNSLIYTNAST